MKFKITEVTTHEDEHVLDIFKSVCISKLYSEVRTLIRPFHKGDYTLVKFGKNNLIVYLREFEPIILIKIEPDIPIYERRTLCTWFNRIIHNIRYRLL